MGLDISLTTKKHDIDFRKHNYLFRWVENRLGEIENCKHYKLPKSDIEELLNSVNEVLADHSKAKELLPTGGLLLREHGVRRVVLRRPRIRTARTDGYACRLGWQRKGYFLGLVVIKGV